MADMSKTIVPKSDQLNADDFMSGSRTVKVAKVIVKDDSEQSLWVYLEGEPKRPFKPCLSMRRVLSNIWGFETDNWIGRQMTLYRDEKVIWAGAETGGIRITHMSNMKEEKRDIMLTVSSNKRAPYRVLRLDVEEPKAEKPRGDIAKALAGIEAWEGPTDALRAGIEKQLAEFAWSGKERAQIGKALESKGGAS